MPSGGLPTSYCRNWKPQDEASKATCKLLQLGSRHNADDGRRFLLALQAPRDDESLVWFWFHMINATPSA